MSDVLHFTISVNPKGFKDMEAAGRSAFSTIEKEQRETIGRMKGAERDFTNFIGAESARRRAAAIADYKLQMAEYVRNNQRQLDEARRLINADVTAAADRATSKHNRKLNDFYRQLGIGTPDDIQRATREHVRQQKAFRTEIERQIAENQKLIARMNAVADSGRINSLGTGSTGGGRGGVGGGGGGFPFGGNGFLSFIGNSAVFTLVHSAIFGIINGIQSLIREMGNLGVAAVKVAADFEKTYLALSVATGSIQAAKAELKAVDDVARNTTGLRLEAAEEGYTRLRNLGFAAETSLGLLRGIAVQKIISGADEAAINRVIVNLTQLSAGSIRASQDIKEIILAMPSIRGAFQDAFGTLNPQTIAAAFKNNPDEAVTKLADAMRNAKAPAAGLSESMDKLVDEVIHMGRAFGEPFVEPLTNAVQGLTLYIRENEDTWKSWGQSVIDAVTGAQLVWGGFSKGIADEMERRAPGSSQLTGAGARGLGRAVLAPLTGGTSELFFGFQGIGEWQRRTEEEANRRADMEKFVRENPNAMKAFAARGFTMDASLMNDGQMAAKAAAAERRALAQAANDRKLEAENRANTFTIETQLAQSNYQIREAMLSSHLARTKEEEMRQVRDLSVLKGNFYNSEISRISAYYDKQIELADNDEIAIAKLTTDKAKAIFDIQRDMELNSIETQRRLTEIERQAAEERRRNAIQYQQLQIDSVRAWSEATRTEIERGLSRGTTAAADGFARLRDIAEETYSQTLARTKEIYQLQLQDDKLTAEARTNIQLEWQQAELRLAEERKNNLASIEDRSYAESIRRATDYTNRMREVWSSQAGIFGDTSPFFNPEGFDGNRGRGLSTALLNVIVGRQERLQEAVSERASGNLRLSTLRGVTSPTDAQVSELSYLEKSAEIVSQRITRLKESISDLPAALTQLEALGISLSKGAVGIEAFDEASKKLLSIKQLFETADLQAEIANIEGALAHAKLAGNATDVEKFTRQLTLLGNKEIALALQQQAEKLDLYANSVEGLGARLAALQAGDAATVLGVLRGVQGDVLREKISLEKENIELQYRLTNVSEDAAARYRNAWLTAMLDVKNASIEAMESQIASQVKISQQTVFNADVARAGIMEAMAGAKGYTEIFQDAFLGVSDAISGGIKGLLDKATEGLGAFGKVLSNIASQLLTMVTNRLMMRLLDMILPPTSGGGGGFSIPGFGGGGGNGGGGFGGFLGSIFGGLFGGRSTPGFNPNAGSGGGGLLGGLLGGLVSGGLGLGASVSSSNLTSGDLLSSGALGSAAAASIAGGGGGALGSAAASAVMGAGKFSLGSIGMQLAQMAPILGLSLGAGLGGSSIGGQILGGLGGLAGGLALGIGTGAIGASGGIMGGLVGALGGTMAATGILAAVAAPLLIGGWLLGRNKLRRQEEKIRTELYLDAFKQLDEILKNVRAHKYGTGQEAIDAAHAVRENYRSQASQLKDKKTRNIALKEIPDRINPRISAIESAARAMDAARERFGELIPEFATGGIVPGQLGAPRLVLAHGGEIIANANQQTPEFLGAAARAGIPGVRGRGGSGSGGGGGVQPIYVEVLLGKKTQNEIFVNGAKSPEGYKVIVQSSNKANEFERGQPSSF